MQYLYYTIEISIKTTKGYTPFCNFQLGKTDENAERIFAGMAGTPTNVNGYAPFQMNLAQYGKGRPVTLATQYCSLAELKENCHYIAKEVFKILNLE
ncbi:MAG: hypothetical protein QM768_17895 [Agriterribacter sp.]